MYLEFENIVFFIFLGVVFCFLLGVIYADITADRRKNKNKVAFDNKLREIKQ